MTRAPAPHPCSTCRLPRAVEVEVKVKVKLQLQLHVWQHEMDMKTGAGKGGQWQLGQTGHIGPTIAQNADWEALEQHEGEGSISSAHSQQLPPAVDGSNECWRRRHTWPGGCCHAAFAESMSSLQVLVKDEFKA